MRFRRTHLQEYGQSVKTVSLCENKSNCPFPGENVHPVTQKLQEVVIVISRLVRESFSKTIQSDR